MKNNAPIFCFLIAKFEQNSKLFPKYPTKQNIHLPEFWSGGIDTEIADAMTVMSKEKTTDFLRPNLKYNKKIRTYAAYKRGRVGLKH